jgi:hypothetical protein
MKNKKKGLRYNQRNEKPGYKKGMSQAVQMKGLQNARHTCGTGMESRDHCLYCLSSVHIDNEQGNRNVDCEAEAIGV